MSPENTEKQVEQSSPPTPVMDSIQRAIGSVGKYQVYLCLLIFLTKFPVAFHQMVIVFQAPPVSYVCPDTNASTCPCADPIYDRTLFTDTIIMYWDLICENSWLKDLTQTITQLGTLIGSILFGVLSDRFGRRIPLLGAVILQLVAGVAAGLVPSYWAYTLFRFLVGASVGGTMVVGFVLIMEFIGTEHRALVSALYQLPFNMGYLLLPAFGYFCRDWSSIQLAISIPVVLLLSYYWLAPESPRWLLAVGQTERAVEILKKAAKWNNLPTETVQQNVEYYQTQKEKDQLKKGTVVDLFRTPNMRWNIIAMSINWLIISYCFYGISQYVGQLSGDIFVNVAASASVTLLGTFLSIPLMRVMGRKVLVIFGHVLCSVCLLIIAAIPANLAWFQVTLACIGVMSSYLAFMVIYLYCSELFPTAVRNNAIGISSMMARVGSMTAPFVAGLSSQAAWLPPVLFGALPLIGAAVCWTLPETKDCPLMMTLEEGENFGKKSKQSKETFGLENKGADLQPSS